jgi:hypothetical protein
MTRGRVRMTGVVTWPNDRMTGGSEVPYKVDCAG